MGRRRRSARDPNVHGLLLIDKPQGMSSFDVIRQLRRSTQVRKMGHTGTLDPMATGLLVICIGEGTKLVPYLTADHKRYEAEVSFGMNTNTYDAEGEETSHAQPETLAQLNSADFEQHLKSLLGPQRQRPPAFSAIRVKGERLYERARRGESVEVPLRDVIFHELTLRSWHTPDSYAEELNLTSPLPKAEVEVFCSKGTYIRSLAFDLGEMMGCGAHLSALRRTAAGSFQLRDASRLDDVSAEQLPHLLIPLADALPTAPVIELTSSEVLAAQRGQKLTLSADPSTHSASLYRGLSPTGDLVALLKREGQELSVARGFSTTPS